MKITKSCDVQTDHVIEAWKPDLVLVDKKEKFCKITDPWR